jgi:hypothetical protein
MSEIKSPCEARDPKWRRCLDGCRPAVDLHRVDCPNADAAKLSVTQGGIGDTYGFFYPPEVKA